MSQIRYIIVSVVQQQLIGFDQNQTPIVSYPVSTSKFGVGSQNGSFKTPLGEHSIAQKIGDGCVINEVFVGRKPIGVLADLQKEKNSLPEDIISSRILWLQGEESGLNKGENEAGESVDSYHRYIYIHGTSEENKIGQPASHGCVRMCNKDVVELFNLVDEGCKVLIQETNNE